jgi:hypothetical protein
MPDSEAAAFTIGLLSEAEQISAVQLAAPDIAARLPLRFEEKLATPCWVDGENGGKLKCLPAFFIAGGMQCEWLALETAAGACPRSFPA